MRLRKRITSFVLMLAIVLTMFPTGTIFQPDTVSAATTSIINISESGYNQSVSKKVDLNGDGKKETLKGKR